jgi:tetratricopeptide (TPR) repeat protein
MLALKPCCNLESMLSKLAVVLILFLFVAGTVVSAAPDQSKRESLLMQRAETCRLAGRLEEAAGLYTQVLLLDGGNCEAQEKRGSAFYALGQYKKALDDATHWVAICPTTRSFFFRAKVLIAEGKPELAVADLDRSLKLQETMVGVLRKAVAQLLSGHFREGRADSYTHLTMVPRSALALELCSLADVLCGLQVDSISKLGQFSYMKLHDISHPHGAQNQGEVKYWAGTTFRQGAMPDVERQRIIVVLEKDHAGLSLAQYRLARAIIYFYQRDYDRALAESARCASGKTKLCSDLLSFYCHMFKRDLPAARDKISSLRALFPDSENVLDAVDLYHYETESRQESIGEINALLAKNPKNEAALIELAKIYHDLSQLPAALKYCDLALQIEPKSTKLLLLKANLLTSQGSYASALKVLSAIKAIDRQNGAAYFACATIFTQEGLWSDAINDLTQAIRLKYDLIRSVRARAGCYGALKKFDQERNDRSLENKLLLN